jgi:hypothetical protein
MRVSRVSFPIVLTVFAAVLSGQAKRDVASASIPREVTAMQGTYKGVWTSFGVDDQGRIVKRMSWTDTMKAEGPALEGDRAFVNTTDEMVFDGARIPPMKITGTEGYLIKPGGTLGDNFIKMYGQEYRWRQLGDNAWAYAAPASPQELAQLGFAKVISGQHVVTKAVNMEQGVETHRITRVTTVNWRDASNEDRWIQFVSLQGVHKREPQTESARP